ncbi:MAG: hypothetical protein VCC99_13860 [Alphaproteobacteria bacterium]
MVSEPDIQNREPRLAAYAERLGVAERDGVALHLHLGSLRAEHRQPFHNRLCHEALRPIVEQHKGTLYQTVSGDLIVILFAIDDDRVNALLARLRLLYAADPLTEGARPSDSGRFSAVYRFADALDEFKALTRRLMKAWTAAQNDDDAPPEAAIPVEARHLPQLLSALQGADLGPMVRREAVCVMAGGSAPHPVFSELTVDYQKLSRQLLANVDLTAHRWYRHVLDDVVHERLLAWFDKERLGDATEPVAIDLSLAGLMSETFLTFDRKTTEATRKKVIFELREADVLGDMGAALFVRDYLQSRGYRVALDGTNHLTLPLIGRERLGFDFIKLRWGPDYETAIVAAQRTQLAAAVERIGQARVILTECNTARAVSAGQGLGIGMFQGAYIETMLRFEAAPRPKEAVSA